MKKKEAMKISELKEKALNLLKEKLVLVIIVAVAGFLFGRGCNGKDDTGVKVDPKKYAAVVSELAIARNSERVKDSLLKIEREARARQNDSSARVRVQLRDEARKSKEMALYWKGVAKQADEANDIETGIAARDSQIVSLYAALDQKTRELEQVDSINARLAIDVTLLGESGSRKSKIIDDQARIIDQLQTDYQKLAKDNQSLRKAAKTKKFWGGFWSGLKTSAAAAGGFILGRAVK